MLFRSEELVQSCNNSSDDFFFFSVRTFPREMSLFVLPPPLSSEARWAVHSNLCGAALPYIGLDSFFFNSKITANISKWYQIFLFLLTRILRLHAAPILFLRHPVYIYIYICIYFWITSIIYSELFVPIVPIFT